MKIEVASIVSQRTRAGMVELTVDDTRVQMDLPKAREVIGMLNGAVEAAISDELVFRFLTERAGLSPEAAGAALLDFREMRQGTRETSYPN